MKNNIFKLVDIFLKLALENFCSINLASYETNLLARLNYENKERAKGRLLNENLQEKIKNTIDALKEKKIFNDELFKAIENKDIKFLNNFLYGSLENYSFISDDVRKIVRDYIFYILESYDIPDLSQEQINNIYNKNLKDAKKSMEEFCDLINNCIQRIKNYSGTKWSIYPKLSLQEDEQTFEAIVECSSNNNLSFIINKENNNFIVFDNTEDPEEFDENSLNSLDYLNLIKEIQKPGSSSQGKNIILYTARPSKDRDFYLNSKTLPNGLYLTNDIDSALGLAVDLGYARDVWEVNINTRFLFTTLDVGKEKQYRVVCGPSGAPVEYFSLIQENIS